MVLCGPKATSNKSIKPMNHALTFGISYDLVGWVLEEFCEEIQIFWQYNIDINLLVAARII